MEIFKLTYSLIVPRMTEANSVTLTL